MSRQGQQPGRTARGRVPPCRRHDTRRQAQITPHKRSAVWGGAGAGSRPACRHATNTSNRAGLVTACTGEKGVPPTPIVAGGMVLRPTRTTEESLEIPPTPIVAGGMVRRRMRPRGKRWAAGNRVPLPATPPPPPIFFPFHPRARRTIPRDAPASSGTSRASSRASPQLPSRPEQQAITHKINFIVK